MSTKNLTTMKGNGGGGSSSSGDKVESFGIIRKQDSQRKKNNKCCKCTSRSSTTRLTIMFLASYLLIFTVVTNFVTSQPVTNLQARSNNNNKLIGKPKEKAAAVATTIPIGRILSSQYHYSYPSLSSSSFYSTDSNGNGISSTRTTDATDVVTTVEHFQQRQEVKNQHYYLGSVQPLSIPIEHVEEEEKKENELTSPFGNENKEMDDMKRVVVGAAAAVEESVNSPANHSPPLHSSHNNNNGNDNVLSLTLTNTLSTGGGGEGGDTAFSVAMGRNSSSSLKYTGMGKKEGKKVELARDKDKVMLTDDVRGSSSTVNPVSSSSSSSSSFSSQNGNSPPPDKIVGPSAAELRAKVNTITAKKEKRVASLLEQHSKMNHTNGMNPNLNKSQSQRFMSTSTVVPATPTGKQDEQVTVTTITTTAWRKKENESSISGNVGDYYYGHDVTTKEKNALGEYANVVNNHVNFVAEKQEQQQQRQMKEKQQGFDTDYSNKKRASSTTTSIEEVVVDADDDDESQSNDKDSRAATAAVASLLGVSDSGIGKSSFLSPTSSSSSADSSSTSRGNLMKSTQRRSSSRSRPVTEMNSGSSSNISLSPLQVSVDKKNNEEKKRSTATNTFAVAGENSKEDNVYQEQSHFYPDYSYDSPVSLLTGEEKDDSPFPPSPYFTLSTEASASSSSLLMNKWIKTLVKLSQCRANCLDQARRRIHHWDATLGRRHQQQQSDILQENHGEAQAAVGADNQKGEEGATKAPSSTSMPLPPTTTGTPNWSEFNQQEEKPKTPVVYTGQMKEKRSSSSGSGSNPLAPFPTATPGRTIKVTPSKSMKYYELSTCQKVCQMKFPIEDQFYYSTTTSFNMDARNNDHSINSLFLNDKKLVELLTTGENKSSGSEKKKKKDMEYYRGNNNIINGSDNNNNSNYHRIASGNNGNGNNNGSNNNNTENNNNNENIEKKMPVEITRERSGGGGGGEVVSVDRKRNNNQQHYYLPSSNNVVGEEEEEEQVLEEISGREALSGGGGSNDLPLMKLLAIERGFADEKENKQKQQHEHSTGSTAGATAGSLNNLKTFPSEPGLKLGQVSLERKKGKGTTGVEEEGRKNEDSDDDDDVATTFSLSSASLILQLSWPKPSSWDRDDRDDDDDDYNKNNQPEGAPPAVAQVKDKKGIHFDGGGDASGWNEKRKLAGEIKAQRPVSAVFSIETTPAIVYSIILEENWNGKGSDAAGGGGGSDGTGDMFHAQRMKLIDQIVARTTTQISLPLLSIVKMEEKVQSEQKRNEDEKEEKNNKNNNNKRKETISVSEQKVERIPSGEADASMEGNKEKLVIIKGNENKRNSEEGIMMSKPLPPPPAPPPPPQPSHEQNKPLLFPSSDPPSKVTTLFRVLAVSREGLEKVYSAQVKVNNSFWDYHLTEHSANDQQVYYREQENLNQQADDSKTWTQNDDAATTAAAASDSHNNKSISSSPAAVERTKFSEHDHHIEKTGNQKKKKGSSSDEQIEKVDKKLDEKIKVEKSGGDGDAIANNFNGSSSSSSIGSNENSNQILVFPSKESLRHTLGVGRGLSGEMKVKKLMSLLKQKKKKSENEVDNDNHHLLSSGSNGMLVTTSTSLSPLSSSGKDDNDEISGKTKEINFFTLHDKDESKSNNIIRNGNEVNNIPSLKISLKENMTAVAGGGGMNETEKSPNWGLHTVSMIYQKFLVVTQVTWDYPGEEQEQTENVQDDENASITNSKANSNNNKNGQEKEKGGTTKKIPPSSSSSSKKWKGCGSRASNNNNAGSGVDTAKGEQQPEQLNFLLSWEIFGGGLTGNLVVTDGCSASISLWPDTAYIIQVGLITPNKMDAAAAGENGMSMTETNGQDFSSYSSYFAAWQNSYNNKQARQASDDNDENGNKLSNHVPPYMSNYVHVKSSEHEATATAAGLEDYKTVGEGVLAASSSTTATASSFDPLILPESITFPFDGEPKVTIKSERILVNTTRAGDGKLLEDEDDTTANVDSDNARGAIHNQDKVTPGNNQSNNNFLTSDQQRRKDKWNNGEEGEINDEQLVLVKKNFESSNDSGGSRHRVSGSNDKVNVSPITITSNSHSENAGDVGPAFEEEEAEMFMLQEENDQPEVESLQQRRRRPTPQLSSSALYRQGKVEQTAKTAAAAAVNEDADQDNNSSVWSDEDEDDATDQDESLFARSLAHQNHQQHRHPQRNNNNNKNIPPPPPHDIRSVSLPQPHTQPEEVEEQQQRNINNNNVPPKSLTSKFHSFMTVNSFYQSLYALSRNALELSHRYPNVITITNEGNGSGGGNKHGNGSSPSSPITAAAAASADANIGPLLIGGFGNSNRTGYLFSATHSTESGEDEDSSGIKGKLYTLFVILVISFVIFLFIVAIVGFCVLTSSIKENYKYFVPKKMRVWTTVGQLIKGPNSNQAGGSSSSSNGGGGGGGGGLLFKDSAEGSFYPRRLQEEPDYEFDDNEDFDPDEDDEEEATSVAETDEEEDDDVESECDCHCVTDNEIVELEDEENSFSLNERCSSDTVKLIKDGEESSVELMAAVDEENEDNGGGVGERSSCGVGGGGVRCNSSSINTSSCSNRGGASHHHHHRGNCDNNNPCYHTTPGAGRILQSAIISSAAAAPPPVKASPVAAALSSLKKNFHRVSSSSNSKRHQQHNQRQTHHHHPHCTHYHQQHHKRKSDVRIDVSGSSSRNGARNLLNQRQEGYY